MLIIGVDGCRKGWIAAVLENRRIQFRFVQKLEKLLDSRPQKMGVDMPIGLLSAAVPGGRECDRQVRAVLGRSRRSSVFSPPVRQTLAAGSYREACEIHAGSSPHRIRLSRQAFGLFPKLREIDGLIGRDPKLQDQIVEVHPELSFYAMHGNRPMTHPKRTPLGRRERRACLDLSLRSLGQNGEVSDLIRDRPDGAQEDDAWDALAALWSAWRIAHHQGIRLPEDPPRDEKGLRMEIWR